MEQIHIAIDGPAGAGKSTIAKILADKIEVDYLDTGAMYRALTYHIIKCNLDIDKEEIIINEAEKIDINFVNNSIYLNNQNIDNEIRSSQVSKNVSTISKISRVREIMVDKQREIARHKSVIMDGRDIGTVVLPNANVKFYLDASIEIRAQRRYNELANKREVEFEDLKNDIIKRDDMDSKRDVSPLKKANDALIIDTTDKSIDQVVCEMINIISSVKGGDIL
ncbi:(d)CMP kinase [Alkalibaculum sp. M08DMB]|uniref:Cytidylate kinase n=1 Tax=Alkalibaculum sporogenes TaxID=2655001 RepID=A0A6A7K751_9FIRM|nr:(d)CMP kinase [Alkalibaculum sporogenes]MPW25206.1 (d)CMP kinase [Alkalibaculum sporogenes]